MHIIYHRTCQGPAFKYLIEPKARERIRIEHAVRLDGHPFVPGAIQICGYCGGELSATELVPSPPPTYNMASQEDMEKLYRVNE